MKRLIGPLVRQKLDAIKLSQEESSAHSLDRQDANVAQIMNQWQRDHRFNEGLPQKRKGLIGSMVRKGSVVNMGGIYLDETVLRPSQSSVTAAEAGGKLQIQSIN